MSGEVWERAGGSAGGASPGTTVADPAAAARRAAARAERVAAGLDDLDRWLRDQIRGGLAGLERAGYPHLERVAARMVDAQAPGVASMLRAIPAELAAESWPERVLDRLAALHLLIQAHRRLDQLPAELAANVRSRIGYPLTKAQVLATPGVRDTWVALGLVDTLEAQLETRRVWLYGTSTRRWALWLSFAVPGAGRDTSVLPGELVDGVLHCYPGSGFRVQLGELTRTTSELPSVPGESLAQVQQRFVRLLAADPWASRMPAVVAAAPVPPERDGRRWRLRDADGHCVDLERIGGEPWPLLARSGGEPIAVFGEWTVEAFRPLSALPDRWGGSFTTGVAA